MELVAWSQGYETGWHLFFSQQLHHKVALLGATKRYLTRVLVRIELVKGLRRVDMVSHIRQLVLMAFVCLYSKSLFAQLKRKEPGAQQSY